MASNAAAGNPHRGHPAHSGRQHSLAAGSTGQLITQAVPYLPVS
jgi:hypothetical protein